MPNNVRAMVDALASGKMADANKLFSDEMEELVSARLADKKIEVASRVTRAEDVPNPEQPEHEVTDASQDIGEVDVSEYDED